MCNNVFVKYDPLVTSQCQRRAKQSFEMVKHISRKNDESCLIFFFTRELYNSLGIFVRPSRDFPDSFHKILFIFFRFLVLIIFGIFCVKMLTEV